MAEQAKHIDMKSAEQLDYWAKTLDASAEELKAAVDAVGSDAAKVEEYLAAARNDVKPRQVPVKDKLPGK